MTASAFAAMFLGCFLLESEGPNLKQWACLKAHAFRDELCFITADHKRQRILSQRCHVSNDKRREREVPSD